MSLRAGHQHEPDTASRGAHSGTPSAPRPRGGAGRWPRCPGSLHLGAGGVIGGRVLLRLAPHAVSDLAAGRDILLVSGTNGKTTSAALLTAALASQMPTDTNADGANTPAGLANALANGAAGTVVLETDEGWLPWMVAQARPRAVVLLNLSRDQLHRAPRGRSRRGEVAHRHRRRRPGRGQRRRPGHRARRLWRAHRARSGWRRASSWVQDDLVCPMCGQQCRHERGGLALRVRAPPAPTRLVGRGRRARLAETTRIPLDLGLPGDVQPGQRRDGSRSGRSRRGASDAGGAARCAGSRTSPAATPSTSTAADGARLILAKNPAGWLETIHLVAAGPSPARAGASTPTASTAAIRPGCTTCRFSQLAAPPDHRGRDVAPPTCSCASSMDGLTRIERGQDLLARAGPRCLPAPST